MVNLSTLNPEQRMAAETIHGPILILAGAGTGKTRVITFRIAHMVSKGIAPDKILAVTFTNKAAREMRERIRPLLPKPRQQTDGKKPPAPTMCTFHSLCVRILRDHIEKLGYKRNFVIYDDSEQISTMKKILANISVKAKEADPRSLLSIISRIKNSGDQLPAHITPESAELARHLEKRYAQALKACNAVDFDDLILLTLKLFQEHPDALDACRERFRYIMVDEYQDTNGAQFKLVHLLAMEHRNLCVVGDDDQSIYGWRGAEIANLLELEKYFPEVKIVKLEQNYRSTNVILKAANAVIQNNPRRRGKKLWSDKGQGVRILVEDFDTEDEEAQAVVDRIEEARILKRIGWGEQAVLFRTNIQSRPLETAFRKSRIRYHLVGGQSFFDRREVRDLLAYAKLFVNPHDDISLLRIANVPARGLSENTMEALLGASQEFHCSVFSAMHKPEVLARMTARVRASLTEFLRIVQITMTELNDPARQTDPHGLQKWTESFLSDIGYWDELRKTEKDKENAENRIMNLKVMIAGMDGEPETATLPPLAERLETFLSDVSLDQDKQDEKENSGDAVTLITMHSCKGLEFPHVFIVGLEDGLLPHTRSKVEGTMDEERRLFYVAITRAMKTLMISHCRSRKKYGELVPCHVSGFLQEIPKDLVEDASEAKSKALTGERTTSLFSALKASLQ